MHTPEGGQDDSRPDAEPAPKTEASNRGHFEDHLSALRDANAGAAVTVWKDGSWQAWQTLDAKYAEGDPNWLCTIPFSDAIGDAFDIVRATAIAAVRREATSAGWDAMLTELRDPADNLLLTRAKYQAGEGEEGWVRFSDRDRVTWLDLTAADLRHLVDHLAAHKPQDITSARDPDEPEVERLKQALAETVMPEIPMIAAPMTLRRRLGGAERVKEEAITRLARAALAAMPARDPVAILIAEAARLRAIPWPYPLLKTPNSWNDHLEGQRLARSYQDAADLLKSWA